MSTPLRFWLSLLVLLSGCESTRAMHNTTVGALKLSRVVLYRNGVAYFERAGVASGEHLSIRARKDQINDLLKSLTVIDRSSGKTVSVSVPLDPKAWQDAALSMLMPGRGKLAQVLDALRGTEVEAKTTERTVHGRIVLVEPAAESGDEDAEQHEDYKLTLLDDATLHIVQLSTLRSLRLRDGNLIMQLDRHLDASSGEGMFQQVDVVVHFADDGAHDLAVSYVAEAPLWKPTYRLVLPEDNSGKALLQVLLEAAFEGLDRAGWLKLSRNWGFFFVFLAVLNEVLRMQLSFGDWLWAKLWVFMPLSFLFTFTQIPMLLKHGLGAEGLAEEESTPPPT